VSHHCVVAELLIPGHGEPIVDGQVVVDDGKIAFAGKSDDAPKLPADATVHECKTVMPGLWDCHVHFLGEKSGDLAALLSTPIAVAAARSVKDAETALGAGVTTVREVGGLGVYIARVVDEGTVVGPSIYGAGAVLSQTGGHGDLHAFPSSYVTHFSERGGCLHICDGSDECRKGVRAQLRVGAKLIKISASGGVLSELDDPQHAQFCHEELCTIVQEAARAERLVAAHCLGKAGIMAALRAGVVTIEHGAYLDEEAAAEMKERGAVLVPTHFIMERVLAQGTDLGVPEYGMRKIEAVAAQARQATEIAVAAGVPIALGTDIASTGPDTLTPWGMHGHELEHLVKAGMTPLAAIEAATANGPLTLGPQAPRSGRLAEGYDADLLLLDANPLDDVSVLANPAHIRKVIKGGRLVVDREPTARGPVATIL